MGTQKIARFYDSDVEREWTRLDRHRTELAVTSRALAEYLPKPNVDRDICTVLDCGGGPGRYSMLLASLGYRVTLLDLSAASLKFAQRKAEDLALEIADYVHASATDLSMFEDEQFDAALLMGPLYHLLDEQDRRRCLTESRRILRPGGVIFAAFICRYAAVRDLAKWSPERLADDSDILTRLLSDGTLELDAGSAFTDFYTAHPNEIAPMMEAVGFHTQALLAQEGIVSMIEDKVNQLEGPSWEAWADLNYRCASDPSIYGGAEHLLYIGRR